MTGVADYVGGLSLLARQMNEQVRALLSHPGEKGRAAEHIVRGIIRTVLPKKFAIGSGFIVTSHGKRSAQLDIVIYDEQLNAPISLVGDIGVFPVECVYGVIEVKSRLTSETIEQAAKSIKKVRQFKLEKYYGRTVLEITKAGKIKEQRMEIRGTLSPRSYVFAFDTPYQSIGALQKALEKASNEFGGFFHGVIVLNKDWFVTQYMTMKGGPKKFANKSSKAVNEFALKLSKDTIHYPMYPANMVRYLGPAEDDV